MQVIKAIYDFISLYIIGPIKSDRIKFLLTGRYYNLTPEDRDKCKDLMEDGNYIWLSRRKSHLTSYLIDWMNAILQRKLPRANYTHAFLNIDNDMLIEAIGEGVVVQYFDSVFDCDWICALKVKGVDHEAWLNMGPALAEAALKHKAKKYDTVFNIRDDATLSCVELVYVVVKKLFPDVHLAALKKAIAEKKNLTPQMLRESASFEVVLEIKK